MADQPSRQLRHLQPGDIILCPRTGLPEQVTARPRRQARRRWLLTTTGDDHIDDAGLEVALAPSPAVTP